MATVSLTVVVDVANVLGARPDGWWHDRAGAARRLLAQVTELADDGLTVSQLPAGSPTTLADWLERAAANGVVYPHWVLVLEGRARDAAAAADAACERVLVVSADGPGDDEVVRQAATRSVGVPCLVVTADRELRRRCAAVGARTVGPGWLLGLL